MEQNDIRKELNHKKVREEFEFLAGWTSVFFLILSAAEKACRSLGWGPLLDRVTTRLQLHMSRVPVGIHTYTYIISAVIALFVYGFIRFKEHKVKKFFGLSSSRGLLFVLPTFRPRPGLAFKPLHRGKNLIDKGTKWSDAERRYLGGAPVYAHHDLTSALNLFKSSRELRYMDLLIEIDENVMNAELLEPIGDLVEGRTVFCLGANSSNYLTRYLLNLRPFCEQPEFYRFFKEHKTVLDPPDAGFVLRCERPFNSHLQSWYIDDDENDYALLLRHTEGQTTYFLCAGLNAHGTQATTRELFENWKELAAVSRGRDFYCLYRVRKPNRPSIAERLLGAVRKRRHIEFEFFEKR